MLQSAVNLRVRRRITIVLLDPSTGTVQTGSLLLQRFSIEQKVQQWSLIAAHAS